MLKYSRFEFNIFGVNTYIIWDEDTLAAAIIDPGMGDEFEEVTVAKFIDDQGLRPDHLINTHLHVDHVMGDKFVETKYGLELEASPDDSFLGEALDAQAAMFHLRLGPFEPLKIGHPLHDGDTIQLGDTTLEVIAVPGHSPGSLAIYSQADRIVLTGDALFRGNIGRSDLPGGDGDTLRRAIRAKLLTLPADTVVLPGHGPATTIAAERGSNPWV
ncbi:MAG: MBL fold metallo-hydrolase [Pseudoflavonifractor sp.]|nr:MBL fold metallo-hydrolase [Alloprevotella sp.]MCM1116648.1 MBL fold metallo-hydrolase [Pseudoflavonifractor sp.]